MTTDAAADAGPGAARRPPHPGSGAAVGQRVRPGDDPGTGTSPSGMTDPSRSVRATITQASLGRAFTILMAIAAIGFGAVNTPSLFRQLPSLDPFWAPATTIVVGLSLLVVGASAFAQRWAQPAQIVCAVLFLVALVTFPLTVREPLSAADIPWPWWLCNVGTIAASLSFATWRAAVYNALVPIVYILLRLSPAGGAVGLQRALLDGVYTAVLGIAALVLIVVLRRAAAAVDVAQATAVRRYSRAIREHATEVERVQVDAIVHDSVLTTLLSAARADTLEAKTLAARMARNAIDHLAAAAADGPGEDPVVPFHALRERITASVSALAAPVEVRTAPTDGPAVPASAADALASAALQAAVNSVQHAGNDVSRWVTIDADDASVRVEVADDGAGFDRDAVPAERLGVRRSIVERMAAAAGAAEVLTAPGSGTRVVLRWPAPRTEPATGDVA
ncbi:ATP-binding protein [Curtobacterium sp. MCSS17_015]|uniref:sensor histidine kinase n=1 Tax=Curtobacterium sp. MCSS17_015 TaxID=2175666 RepID=UPI000DA9AA56|nr:ATP-binding protein [Curtobacterium sp. MCSS17_015]WIB25357.1 ATP-binding protein [Curtobacterium sp. MCSS17_015]